MQFSTTKNYYKVLGLSRSATADAIKKKYRKLAKEHHPDTNAGSKKSEDKFKKVSEAYEVLGDEKKRQAYDRMFTGEQNEAGPSSRRRRRARSDQSRYGYGSSDSGPRNEYREPFSGQGFQEEVKIDPNFPTRGFDLQFFINVPLVTASLGGKIPFSYDKYVNCTECSGPIDAVGNNCPACKGKRQVVKNVSIDVTVPPGIVDQYTLRMENKGGDGRNGGPPGDLLLKVCIEPHPSFNRINSDIYAEVVISSELAENGGNLEVKTLDSVKIIPVEEGTLSGEDYRIPGQGASVPWGKKRGDFIIKFSVAEP
jgi:DnaJ-class molecular chaperone